MPPIPQARKWLVSGAALVCVLIAALIFCLTLKRGSSSRPHPGSTPSTDAPAGNPVRMESELQVEPGSVLHADTAPTSQRPQSAVRLATATPDRPAAKPDPAKPCQLHFQVADAEFRPVKSLQSVFIERADGGREDTLADLSSDDGAFACSIPDAAGKIRVHSAALGDASAEFPRPAGGASWVDLNLSNFATIHGRVVKGAQAVEGAAVCLLKVNSAQGDPEVAIVAGRTPDPCRHELDEVKSGNNGEYQFAVEGAGEYVLVARQAPLGACTSAPIAIASARESRELDLALAPASRMEVRHKRGGVAFTRMWQEIWGDNGIHEVLPLTNPDEVARFDSLPSGNYMVGRECQTWGPETGDPPARLEVDGAPGTLVRHELRDKGAIQLSVALGQTGSRVRARLFWLACSYTLVSEVELTANEVTLAAGDPGTHLLAVRCTSGSAGPSYTRIARVSLAEGANRLELAPIEFSGEIVCTSDKFDLDPRQTFVRYRMPDSGQLFVEFQKGRAHRGPKTPNERFVCSCKAPTGTCDLVCIRKDGFVVLQGDLHVAAGEPTIARLGAGAAGVLRDHR